MHLRPSWVTEAVEVEKLIVVDSLLRETTNIIVRPVEVQGHLELLEIIEWFVMLVM